MTSPRGKSRSQPTALRHRQSSWRRAATAARACATPSRAARYAWKRCARGRGRRGRVLSRRNSSNRLAMGSQKAAAENAAASGSETLEFRVRTRPDATEPSGRRPEWSEALPGSPAGSRQANQAVCREEARGPNASSPRQQKRRAAASRPRRPLQLSCCRITQHYNSWGSPLKKHNATGKAAHRFLI